MIDLELKRNVLGLRDLPTLPEVVARLIRTVGDDDSSAAEVSAILEIDHAISARVLRVANSAFYGAPRGISTMRHAVVVIGFEGIRLLAMATSVIERLAGLEQRVLDPREFWMHSFGTAHAATLLGVSTPGARGTEHCYTAGLLHDIGKYILALACKERYAEVLKLAWQCGKPLEEVERAKLHTCHGEVASWAAHRWRFPEKLAELVGHVGSYQLYRGPLQREVRAIALADQLSCLAGFGSAGSLPISAADMPLADSLGLSSDDVTGRIEQLRHVRDDTARLLDQLTEVGP